MHHVSVNVGEPEVATLVSMRSFLVIDSLPVQNRHVRVAVVNRFRGPPVDGIQGLAASGLATHTRSRKKRVGKGIGAEE